LLVATREELDRLFQRGRPHFETFDQLLDGAAFRSLSEETEAGETPEGLDSGVGANPEHRHQRLMLAITGQQHDPRPDRFVG
jgi:hypothetical protein